MAPKKKPSKNAISSWKRTCYLKILLISLQEGIPVLIVVIIGIVLLLLNVCACGAVVYQKHRVREREDNLRRRIKRLSDAGMIRSADGSTENQALSGRHS